MPYVKNNSYRNMPFSSEISKAEFYTFSSVADLAVKCEAHKDLMTRCRTIGILQSVHGRFFLTDIDSPSIKAEVPMIRVSLVYVKSLPQSSVTPYPVQIFGTLHWKNRPVIYAKILLALSVPMAIRVRNAMCAVTSIHLATNVDEDVCFEDPT